MRFDKASAVEETAWNLRLADQPRATRRALIDQLFNGVPPYSPTEQKTNSINVNVNFLEPTKLSGDARSQYESALLSTQQYFSVKVDRGTKHRRSEWSEMITSNLRKGMKEGYSALNYIETIRNISAQLVIHGAVPCIWPDKERWCPSMQMIGDVLIPSQTLLTMENLSYFGVYRRYTAAKLYEMTHGPKVDPGWDKALAGKAIQWALTQYGQAGVASNSDYTYNPERIAEDFKESGGTWQTDQVPTINCIDFYSKEEDGDDFGWKRRMVLDCAQDVGQITQQSKTMTGDRGIFLYDSTKRKAGKTYATNLSHIAHFQFADGSVVAPFRYHSVRSLGFLLYSVCHLQNRLRCSFTEAAFEACMQYLRSDSDSNMEQTLKLHLNNRAVIPNNIRMVPQNERWQVNEKLIQAVLGMNKDSIANNATSYTRDFGQSESNPVEKTATQITAEVNASTAMVGAMLQQAYMYQRYQYREIARRFCLKNSRDIDVRTFRKNCLSQGVPEELLDVECWEISVEQIMGNGNKQLAIAQAQMVMQFIDRLDPDAQRVALRDYMFAVTGNASKVKELVPPEANPYTNSMHDAELASSTLLMGIRMQLKQGVSHLEYASVLVGVLGAKCQEVEARGGMATAEQIEGFQNLAGETIEGQPLPGNGARSHIDLLARDLEEKENVKKLNDVLSKQMNLVRAFAQRLEEARAQATQGGNGEPALTPQDATKLKSELEKNRIKAESMAEAHQQRSQQRAEIHSQKMREKQESDQLNNANEIRRTQVDEAATDLRTAAEIQRENAKAEAEPKTVAE